MFRMIQERRYEEPIRFFGGDVPKQTQEYKKQRLLQLVECECGEICLMKDAYDHISRICHNF